MRYFSFLFCVLLALPLAAKDFKCPHCDSSVTQSQGLVILPDGKGGWSLCKQLKVRDSCLAKADGNKYLIDGTALYSRLIGSVFLEEGVTPEQATIALNHPDSPALITTILGGPLWLFIKAKAVVEKKLEESRLFSQLFLCHVHLSGLDPVHRHYLRHQPSGQRTPE